jgi:hypothetical protein
MLPTTHNLNSPSRPLLPPNNALALRRRCRPTPPLRALRVYAGAQRVSWTVWMGYGCCLGRLGESCQSGFGRRGEMWGSISVGWLGGSVGGEVRRDGASLCESCAESTPNFRQQADPILSSLSSLYSRLSFTSPFSATNLPSPLTPIPRPPPPYLTLKPALPPHIPDRTCTSPLAPPPKSTSPPPSCSLSPSGVRRPTRRQRFVVIRRRGSMLCIPGC